MQAFIHARTVIVHGALASDTEGPLAQHAHSLLALAAGRAVAAELCAGFAPEAMAHALQRLGHVTPQRARLWVRFPFSEVGRSQARRFTGMLSDQEVFAGPTWLLVDPVHGRKRVAALAYRREASVTALDEETVVVAGYFYRPPPQAKKGKMAEKAAMPPAATLEDALRHHGLALAGSKATDRHDHNDAVSIEVSTPEPGRALLAMQATADAHRLSLWPSLSEPEPLQAMLRRLRSDLAQP
jgi:hypothetical protein